MSTAREAIEKRYLSGGMPYHEYVEALNKLAVVELVKPEPADEDDEEDEDE